MSDVTLIGGNSLVAFTFRSVSINLSYSTLESLTLIVTLDVLSNERLTMFLLSIFRVLVGSGGRQDGPRSRLQALGDDFHRTPDRLSVRPFGSS